MPRVYRLKPGRALAPAGKRDPLTWLGGLLVAYLVLPIAGFTLRAVSSRTRGFATPGLWTALATSVTAATIATGLVAVVGIPLAYRLAGSRGRMASVVGVAVQLPLALPPVMSGIVLIYLVGPYTTIGRLFGGRLTDSLAGVIIAQGFVASPFLVIAARSAFAATDPALEDTAATLGLGPLDRFFRVALPAAAGGIRAGLLLTWLRAFGEYGATVLLAYHPYSLPVFTFVQFSGVGIPTTQAPTLLAIGVAVVAVALSRLHPPSRRTGTLGRLRPGAGATGPRRPPTRSVPTPVTFDLDVSVEAFRLRISHAAACHRIAILGPSGSGKSITLRSLAGLLGADVGAVSYGDDPVERVATEARRVGYVPQSPALLESRTVWDQVTLPHDTDPDVARWWMATLQLDGLEDRLPAQLSGGQRQRVLFAQALSREPRLLLLDEPFSSLDAPVRAEMRRTIRRLQLDAGLSTVLVTHDPEEAALLADEILVLGQGRILQAGDRAEVFGHPTSPEVGRLLGVANLHPGTVRSATGISCGDAVITVATQPYRPGIPVLWTVPPERLTVLPPLPALPVLPDAGTGDEESYPARVLDIIELGTTVAIEVQLCGGPELRIVGPNGPGLAIGDACRVRIPWAAVRVWRPGAGAEPRAEAAGAEPRPEAAGGGGYPALGVGVPEVRSGITEVP